MKGIKKVIANRRCDKKLCPKCQSRNIFLNHDMFTCQCCGWKWRQMRLFEEDRE